MTPPSAGSEELLQKAPTRIFRMATMICMIASIVAVFDFILFGTLLPRNSESFGWSPSEALLVSTLVSVGTTIVLFTMGPRGQDGTPQGDEHRGLLGGDRGHELRGPARHRGV